MSQPVLEVTNLLKRYDDFVAVDNISFSVPKGAVVGLLGPNGAGKTTTIQMLMGITLPTSGTISYFGQNFATHKQQCLQRINYSSAYNELQDRITVRENLAVFAQLYNVANSKKKIDELGEYFGIEDLMKQRFVTLSAGQRTRVNLTKALLNDPELIMLDEPTASLDPDVRNKLMLLIESMRADRGISILYTSHNMDEIVRLCDDVIFLDHGVIRHHTSPAELAEEVFEPSVAIRFGGDQTVLLRHFSAQGVKAEVEDDTLVLHIGTQGIPAALGSFSQLPQIEVLDIEVRKPSLDAVFMHYSSPGTHE